jgi:hypothetical protein
MAKERYTVLYQVEDAGNQAPANWKEKTIKVAKTGKEKNAGLVNSDTEPSRTLDISPLVKNVPLACKLVTIEAEGAEEAVEAIRAFYGQGTIVNGLALAGPTSGLTEVKYQS